MEFFLVFVFELKFENDLINWFENSNRKQKVKWAFGMELAYYLFSYPRRKKKKEKKKLYRQGGGEGKCNARPDEQLKKSHKARIPNTFMPMSMLGQRGNPIGYRHIAQGRGQGREGGRPGFLVCTTTCLPYYITYISKQAKLDGTLERIACSNGTGAQSVRTRGTTSTFSIPFFSGPCKYNVLKAR